MTRRPPISTRPATLFPDTTLFRSGRWFPKESLSFSLTDCTPCLRFFTPLPGAPRLAGRCRHHVLAEWPVYDEPYAAEAYNRPDSGANLQTPRPGRQAQRDSQALNRPTRAGPRPRQTHATLRRAVSKFASAVGRSRALSNPAWTYTTPPDS